MTTTTPALTSAMPTAPLASTVLPPTSLVRAAYAYVHEHNSAAVANHSIRSAFLALILRKKMPALEASVDAETLVLATLLHDLGWAKTPELVSADKRFEVDGANAAREFVRARLAQHEDEDRDGESGVGELEKSWDEARLQSLWYAIALHTTPSLAMHAEPLAVATAMGIQADFMGPKLPSNGPGVPQLITSLEFTEIIRAYPRITFKEELREVMCGLCRSKPEATFDNFAAEYGKKFVEGYEQKWEQYSVMNRLENALDATAEFE